MTLGMTVMAWATTYDDISGDYSLDGDYTDEDVFNCSGDTNFTVTGETTIGSINGGTNNVSISGGGTLNVNATGTDAISGSNVSIDNTTVNATVTNKADTDYWGSTISATQDLTVTGATVNATSSATCQGITADGNITFTNSDVNSKAKQGHAIVSYGGDININSSNVKASNDMGGAIITDTGEIKIGDGLTITTPEGGQVANIQGAPSGQAIYDSNGPTKDYDMGAKEVVIESPVIKPDESPCDDKKEEEKKEEKKEDSSSSSSDSTPAATNDNTTTVDPVVQSVAATLASSFAAPELGADVGVKLEEPGAAAQAAFIQAMPAGFTKGFAFSITNGGKTAFTAKKGKVSFNIPAQYRKAGRKFKLMGIGKDGKVKIFDNLDASGEKLTVNLDIEGYQFEVIYAD